MIERACPSETMFGIDLATSISTQESDGLQEGTADDALEVTRAAKFFYRDRVSEEDF